MGFFGSRRGDGLQATRQTIAGLVADIRFLVHFTPTQGCVHLHTQPFTVMPGGTLVTRGGKTDRLDSPKPPESSLFQAYRIDKNGSTSLREGVGVTLSANGEAAR
jgi:hypothetical protein